MEVSWIGIAILTILVTIWHELGHLVAARWLHIPVKRVSVGFGPTLWRLPNISEAELLLRAFPLGMSIGVPGRYDENSRLRRPLSHDMLLAAAGPLASILLPIPLLALSALADVGPAAADWLIAACVLSVLLGFLNLLPVPGMDGGHLLVLTLAKIGFRLSPRQEVLLHKTGLAFTIVACLLLVVYYGQQWIVT